MTGIVQSFSDERGFGFIKDARDRTVFVHYTQIAGEGFKTLSAGQKVEFDCYETDQGFEAKEVKKI